MSVDNVVMFLDRLKKDDTLSMEYARVTRESMQAALRSAVVDLAARHGCEFTADELNRHLDQIVAELDDDDLDKVAGGGVEPSPFMPIDPWKGQAAHGQHLAQLLRPSGRAGWDPGEMGR